MSSIDRLRSKIDAYVEVFTRTCEEENASMQLAAAFPKEDHSYPCTAETKILDILRPLIFVHWSRILKQIPEPGWKEVCKKIAAIDRMRTKAKAALQAMYTAVERAPVVVSKSSDEEELDEDQQHDLAIFEDASDEEEVVLTKRPKQQARPTSPCTNRGLFGRAALHAFMQEDSD